MLTALPALLLSTFACTSSASIPETKPPEDPAPETQLLDPTDPPDGSATSPVTDGQTGETTTVTDSGANPGDDTGADTAADTAATR